MLVTFATAKRNARGNYYFNDICSKLYENGKASSACTNTLAAGHTHRQNIYYMVVASFPFSLPLWISEHVIAHCGSVCISTLDERAVKYEATHISMCFWNVQTYASDLSGVLFLMHYFRSHANKSIDWIYSHTYEPCRFIWFSFACERGGLCVYTLYWV